MPPFEEPKKVWKQKFKLIVSLRPGSGREGLRYESMNNVSPWNGVIPVHKNKMICPGNGSYWPSTVNITYERYLKKRPILLRHATFEELWITYDCSVLEAIDAHLSGKKCFMVIWRHFFSSIFVLFFREFFTQIAQLLWHTGQIVILKLLAFALEKWGENPI